MSIINDLIRFIHNMSVITDAIRLVHYDMSGIKKKVIITSVISDTITVTYQLPVRL